MLRTSALFLQGVMLYSVIFCGTDDGYAASLPGSADPSRVVLPTLSIPEQAGDSDTGIVNAPSPITVPETAKSIHFTLKNVVMKGNTAFKDNELQDIFSPYIGRDITLDIAWAITGQITERYHAKGYFLSRAYVPAQTIEEGRLEIHILEGYIGQVEYKSVDKSNRIIVGIIKDIKRQRPVTTKRLESLMLRLNDLPDLKFHGTILPDKALPEGAVKLILEEVHDHGRGLISLDNFGSRFLGPYQQAATYQKSFFPNQLTTVSASTSIPFKELAYGAFNHDITLSPQLTLMLNGSYVKARPGYRLVKNHINSNALEAGLGLRYQPIRQRQGEFIFYPAVHGKEYGGRYFR